MMFCGHAAKERRSSEYLKAPQKERDRSPQTKQTTMSSSIVYIKNDTEAKAASLLDASALSGQKSVLFFYAEWHEPSAAGGPFDMW